MLRDPVLNAVPIVMITGTVTDEDAAASYRFGNLPLLTKPFLGHDLAEYALGILEPQHAAAA
jgi:CheY-like chemotaxis protein